MSSTNLRDAVDFQSMLTALRSLRPLCPDCTAPMDIRSQEVRVRESDSGQLERVCRSCFNGEIASMQQTNFRT